MRTDHDLIHLLDDEPPTPSTVDVRGAIVTGRRRRTIRRAGFAGAAVTALAVTAVVAVGGNLFTPRPAEVADPAFPLPTCTVETLPGVSDPRVTGLGVTGSDSTGRYHVGRTEPVAEAVLWADGKATIVDLPGEGKAALTDVNASGTAVGWRFAKDGDAEPVPFVVERGTVTPLPGVEHGIPHAINDSGVIAGESDGYAVRWASPHDAAARLMLSSGTYRSRALAVDRDGVIVGETVSAVEWSAVVWPSLNEVRALQASRIDGRLPSVRMVSDIRNGWIVGTASTTLRTPTKDIAPEVQKTVTMRWDVAGNPVEIIDQSKVTPATVTSDGWIIGNDATGTPVLYNSDVTTPLPLPADSQAATDSRYTASDDGRVITGLVVHPSGARRPVLWRCN
ncbi:hypothetical protein [Actinoplanes subglobosus]|uniref:Uncharacterized protein n=1 Tax=Actinoplanes subglobosus TaxID=1547892 RepID=A0ABV8IUJ2_9ACTN